MSVVLHPSAVLADRLREADASSGGDLIQLFIEAIDLGAARKPILKMFLPQKDALCMPHIGHVTLFDWSRRNSFHAKRSARPAVDPLENNGPATPADEAPRDEKWTEMQAVGAAYADAMMKSSKALAATASVHRYGMFPPGWEVDNVEWANTFGDDDPCLVVSDFIRGLFSGPSRYARDKKIIHVLDGTDRKILDIILSSLAKQLADDDNYFHGYDQATIRRLLNAACDAWVDARR